MAEDNLQLPSDRNIDYHIVTLFQRLETIRKDSHFGQHNNNHHKLMKTNFNMQAEIRTLEFWRSIIAECLASFLYVFIVCGAAAGAGVGASVSSVLLATALASGFAVATITQCFSHISGAHINPSVTLAMLVIRSISPLRATMYITAQCGGGIAGAALLYGVTVPGYQGNLQAAISQSASLAAWERLGVELILTFIVVLAYFMSTDSYKQFFGSAPLSIGAAYSACSFVSMPYLNPARSLGPSFVLNKWENHWVYWIGPLLGGALSGIVYKYIFHTNNNKNRNIKRRINNGSIDSNALDNDSTSVQSDDDINYDLDLDKPSGGHNPHQSNHHHHHGHHHGHHQQQQQHPITSSNHHNHQQSKYHNSNSYRSNTLNSQNVYSQNLYSTAAVSTKLDTVEPVYGGTRSMYCKSPPLTRANLNRSQSVYAKSNTAINRELGLRPGPLIPAQSLYPMRVSQNAHVQNQNVQNQLQQRSESIYGIRSSMRQHNQQQQQQPPSQDVVQATTITASSAAAAAAAAAAAGASAVPTGAHNNMSAFHHTQQSVYGTRTNPSPSDGLCKFERNNNNDNRSDIRDDNKFNIRQNRPESIHGMQQQTTSRRGQSVQSDDSSYGSYHGPPPPPPLSITPPTRNQNGDVIHHHNNNNLYPNGQQLIRNQQQQQQQQQHHHHQQQQPLHSTITSATTTSSSGQQIERKISNSSGSDRQVTYNPKTQQIPNGISNGGGGGGILSSNTLPSHHIYNMHSIRS